MYWGFFKFSEKNSLFGIKGDKPAMYPCIYLGEIKV